VAIVSSCQASEVGLSEAVDDEATGMEAKKSKMRQDLNEMRVAASEHSTQDTSIHTAIEMATDCAIWLKSGTDFDRVTPGVLRSTNV